MFKSLISLVLTVLFVVNPVAALASQTKASENAAIEALNAYNSIKADQKISDVMSPYFGKTHQAWLKGQLGDLIRKELPNSTRTGNSLIVKDRQGNTTTFEFIAGRKDIFKVNNKTVQISEDPYETWQNISKALGNSTSSLMDLFLPRAEASTGLIVLVVAALLFVAGAFWIASLNKSLDAMNSACQKDLGNEMLTVGPKTDSEKKDLLKEVQLIQAYVDRVRAKQNTLDSKDKLIWKEFRECSKQLFTKAAAYLPEAKQILDVIKVEEDTGIQ